MKKRIVIAILCATMSVGMVGCNKTESSSDKTQTSTENKTTKTDTSNDEKQSKDIFAMEISRFFG